MKIYVLDELNLIFSFIFIGELILKLITYSKSYFLSGWNIFDFFVVCASFIDIIVRFSGSGSSTQSISSLAQIARIFRVMRITRLLRMFKRFKGLQKLIETFVFSMPAIGRGLSVIFLFFFIFSVLASYLFGNVISDYSGNFDEIRNFSDFHHALQTLFIMNTG